MRMFKNLVGRWSCSAARPRQMLAVLFMGFATAITMHAQSTNLVPSAGSGAEQAFVATFTDPNGVQNVQSLSIAVVGVAPSSESGLPANGCVLNFIVGSGIIQLAQDTGKSFLTTTATAGTDQTVSNSQCTVLGASSSITISGNTVTARIFLTFTASFSGTKQIFMLAENSNQATDMNSQAEVGTYDVTASVSPAFISPSSGSGSDQTFTTIYSDPTSHIQSVGLNIKSSRNNTSAANACKVRYDPDTSNIFLVNDAGTTYGSPIIAGSATSLSNSQCTVYGMGTSATTFGANVIVYFSVSFFPGFVGEKVITMGGADETGASTFSDLPLGTYLVTAPSSGLQESFDLSSTAVRVESVGVPATSTITVIPNESFKGRILFTCTVINPSNVVSPPTCAFDTPPISVTAPTTVTLFVNTAAASAQELHNPVQQTSFVIGGLTMAAILFLPLPHRRKWRTLLSFAVVAVSVGGATGCAVTHNQGNTMISSTTYSRTTPGNYIVAVTGISGSITATTAVSVTVK
ncbi:hypothetical protein RBB77_12535 [Tunturibacter psychrotolerans]|uniref:Ig-like domain repeat protein n=1 Tax=Tunturiibacter psychrotolerans TaxID=3069686 RepID=A0AAU7ZJE6_9BACT